MSRGKRLAAVCWTAFAFCGCEKTATSDPLAPVKVAPPPNVSADWYPTNPDGSEDLGAETALQGEYGNSFLTGSAPLFSAKVVAGYWMIGSNGEIAIYPAVLANRSQTVSVSPEIFPITPPNGAMARYETSWQESIYGLCEVKLGGFVDFTTRYVSAQFQWSRRFRTFGIPPKQVGPSCVAPTVSISPSGTVTLPDASTPASFTASVTPGTGTVEGTEWYVDGYPNGSGTSWSASLSTGVHSVYFQATNSAGFTSTSNTATVIVPEEETDTDLQTCDGVFVDDASDCSDEGGGGGGGEGAGGNGSPPCEVWLFTLRLSYDEGATWHVVSQWYEYVNC